MTLDRLDRYSIEAIEKRGLQRKAYLGALRINDAKPYTAAVRLVGLGMNNAVDTAIKTAASMQSITGMP